MSERVPSPFAERLACRCTAHPAGYAAQSLLSALGCIQFVSNVIFAGAVLKEPVTFSVLLATACIVAGCVLLVAFGNHASHEYTSHDLIALYGE